MRNGNFDSSQKYNDKYPINSYTFTLIVDIQPIITSVEMKVTVSQEAVAQRCYVKKVFLEIWKIHRKTPAPKSFF